MSRHLFTGDMNIYKGIADSFSPTIKSTLFINGQDIEKVIDALRERVERLEEKGREKLVCTQHKSSGIDQFENVPDPRKK